MNKEAENLMGFVDSGAANDKIDRTRAAFTEITAFVMGNLCDGREKSLVLTKIEEAGMWSIKSISREVEDKQVLEGIIK